ncbi:MAG: anthranilate phosphoribosyltransferase [Meiothermus sp.]|uniref:anthranilate phosphoribosyltransferase n=1 Tax=Meiothermus sp. TaxID=1955249 RepID=UPI0025FA5CB0|nr:anthranilate phosphoribosyltransferase [Meiothermus sp.]MCS7059234.1 anthranilate phosphoribosyltransferase [Meiothermus sp.]MCS7195016.1 anthranilate phosphoribosyltransferase [Meiothermus sp.]MCX7740939.1 anthranilate phosphoribosyltransferase [Meiothermus sp.]MDW8089900.1 anthranilate phosphoribosyltransferase [Meiothermus sp.]MDW8481672.1 anthranilate phosphoribosyltransferase [Meiothermus sp.]
MDELKKALLAEPLSQAEAQALMRRIMAGDLTPVQTAGVLMALRTRGETPEEIAGFAAGMREAAVRVETRRRPLMDIVGTGGVAPDAFNISTTTCFVVAAGGVPVAKHGNRAASSKSGSFDLLEALGVRIDLPPERVAESIEALGLGFLFARNHHPAMRYVAPVRAELGVRTVFNLLGPLTNPAFATLNLVGVHNPSLLLTFAQVLGRLGSERAMVVHGEGVDELVLGVNQVAELRDGEVRVYTLRPEEVGLASAPYEAIRGGTPQENAETARAILGGKERGPKRDAVALNAGAAFYLAGKVDSLAEGVSLAQGLLDEGAGLALLERLVRFTNA